MPWRRNWKVDPDHTRVGCGIWQRLPSLLSFFLVLFPRFSRSFSHFSKPKIWSLCWEEKSSVTLISLRRWKKFGLNFLFEFLLTKIRWRQAKCVSGNLALCIVYIYLDHLLCNLFLGKSITISTTKGTLNLHGWISLLKKWRWDQRIPFLLFPGFYYIFTKSKIVTVSIIYSY